MRFGRLVTSIVLMLAASGLGRAQSRPAAPAVPVLAELFTSEGCNSCPPADALLEILLHQQPIDGVYVVAMSEHVTYWDHQGWKDPFGSQQFTARQQDYGRRFNIDSIYTPQLVVDGAREVIGSDKRAIEKALLDAIKTPKPALNIELTCWVRLKPDATGDQGNHPRYPCGVYHPCGVRL